MIVYRIENEHGRGPFYTGAIRRVLEAYPRLRKDPYDMPAPSSPGEKAHAEHFLNPDCTTTPVFAFPTRAAMGMWFSRAMLKALEAEGQTVCTYDVPEAAVCACTRIQVTYFSDRATEVTPGSGAA